MRYQFIVNLNCKRTQSVVMLVLNAHLLNVVVFIDKSRCKHALYDIAPPLLLIMSTLQTFFLCSASIR